MCAKDEGNMCMIVVDLFLNLRVLYKIKVKAVNWLSLVEYLIFLIFGNRILVNYS